MPTSLSASITGNRLIWCRRIRSTMSVTGVTGVTGVMGVIGETETTGMVMQSPAVSAFA